MEETQINKYMEMIIDGILGFGPKVIAAILILFIGFKLLKRIDKLTKVFLEKSGLETEIVSFLSALIDIALKAFLILIVAGIVGIDTASFVAVLAAAGFAIGLALQGSLANFAAGILIILFKPYRIGDFVEMEERFGKIVDINIFNTIMETPGNKTLIVPNGKAIDGIIANISEKGKIRLEMEVSMPYSEDWPKVEKIISDALMANPKVLKDPKPELGILSYDSHFLIIAVRPYVIPEDYWDVQFEAYAQIKRAFHDNHISIAYSEGVEIGNIGK